MSTHILIQDNNINMPVCHHIGFLEWNINSMNFYAVFIFGDSI